MPSGAPLDPTLSALLAEGAVVRAADRFTLRAFVKSIEEEIVVALRAFHAERPLLAGIPSAELATKRPARARALVPVALASLASRGVVAVDREVVRLRDHDPRAAKAPEEVLAAYAKAGLAPPSDADVEKELGLGAKPFKDALTELKRAGKLRMLSGGLHYEVSALHALAEKVARHFDAAASLTPPDFKTLAGGLTRKHAIPLLEWLDAEGVTRRQGDLRVAGPRSKR